MSGRSMRKIGKTQEHVPDVLYIQLPWRHPGSLLSLLKSLGNHPVRVRSGLFLSFDSICAFLEILLSLLFFNGCLKRPLFLLSN